MVSDNPTKKFDTAKKPDGGNPSNPSAPKGEGNIVQRLFGFIAGCMTPLLPAMLGCGMLKVVLTLLTTFCSVSATDPTYILISSLADAFFYFLPVLVLPSQLCTTSTCVT